jgi:hypothetical protein
VFFGVVRLQSSRGMLKYSFVKCCDCSDNGLLDALNEWNRFQASRAFFPMLRPECGTEPHSYSGYREAPVRGAVAAPFTFVALC